MKNIKRKYFGFALIGITTLLIGSFFVFAKGERGSGFGKGGFPPQGLVNRISKELGLSDEQKTQANQILDDAKTRVEPLFETMKQNHEASKSLGTDGNFDEAKVNELASQQAETMKQLFIEKEKAKAQLFAILTPEQREQAKQLQDKFGERMKGRFGRGHKGEPKDVE
jgi:Spy/CpxP family protein refolding chaperone